MSSRFFAVLVVFTSALVAPSAARADDLNLQYGFGVDLGFVRQTPALRFPSDSYLRENARGKIPMPGGFTFAGAHLDVTVTLSDRWQIPLVGAGIYGAVGSYDAVVTTYDGSIVRVRPWTAVRPEFHVLGLGYRWKHRRNQVGFMVRTGASFVEMQGSFAYGGVPEAVELSAATFMVQIDLEACRRLDPATRLCLHVAPRVYDYELFNGGIIGIRMEWGR